MVWMFEWHTCYAMTSHSPKMLTFFLPFPLPVSNIYWLKCFLSSSSLISFSIFLPHQHLSHFPPPVMSRLNLYNKVSISMTGHNVQLQRVGLPRKWVKVTEFKWFCLQFWLHCASQAIILPCWDFFYILHEITVSKNTAIVWHAWLSYYFYVVC